MGLSIVRSGLKSRGVRRAISGSRGVRKIDLSQSIASTGENQNLLQKIFGGVGGAITKLTGFIAKKAGGLLSDLTFSFTDASAWLLERVEELKAFNWNATDAELQQSIQGYNTQLAAIWGELLLGFGLGYLGTMVLGVGISILVPVIGGTALAAAVATAVTAGLVPQFLEGFETAINQTIAIKARQTVLSGYINARHFIKQLPIEQLAQLPGIDENFAKKIKEQWGAEGAPVVSFNKFVDDQLEKIENPITQEFIRSGLEEGWNLFTEGVFIVAGELDNALAQRDLEGRLRAVEVLPDKNNPDEKILFYGRENSLMSQITGTLNTHQFIHNRDIGFAEETRLTAIPAPPQKRTLRIILYSSPSPPWRRSGKRLRKAEHLIPDPKPGLTWQEVKRAVGGSAGIRVGAFAATVRFANRRQMTVRGDTKDAAITNARKLAELSESEVLRVHVSERVASRQTPGSAVTVYGAFIHVGKVIPDSTSDRQNMDGQRYREEKVRYPLWLDDAPGNLRGLFT